MDKKELKRALVRLPKILSGMVAQDHQIIEADEGGCHYKITKEVVAIIPLAVVYSLSVSGEPKRRQALIQQFVDILGAPVSCYQLPGLPHINYVLWDADKIDAEIQGGK